MHVIPSVSQDLPLIGRPTFSSKPSAHWMVGDMLGVFDGVELGTIDGWWVVGDMLGRLVGSTVVEVSDSCILQM